MECQSALSSMSKMFAWTRQLPTVPTHAPSVVILHMEQLAAPKTELGSVLYILYIHIPLYIAEGWCQVLCDLDITHLFPLLVNDIVYGSPIGNPPPLWHTFIPVNLPSTLRLPCVVNNKIAAKLVAKRMSGPFSVTQAKIIFGGHFCTSPLGLIEVIPSSGKWWAICHLSNPRGSVKNGFSDLTKVQEGRDRPRKDVMNRHRGRALSEGCHERKKAQMVVSSREKINNNIRT